MSVEGFGLCLEQGLVYLLLALASEAGVPETLGESVDLVLKLGSLDLIVRLHKTQKYSLKYTAQSFFNVLR